MRSGRHDQEPDQVVAGGDPRTAAQDRLVQHGRPFDLEAEGGLAAQVPDAVDGLQRLRRTLADQRQVDALLDLREQVPQRLAAVAAALLPRRDPAAQAQAMAVLGQHANHCAVLVGTQLERVVGAQQAVGGRLPGPV